MVASWKEQFLAIAIQYCGSLGRCSQKGRNLFDIIISSFFLRLSIESSLMADAWSLQKISEYKGGKILIWSWVSRGLVTRDQVAGWLFDGQVNKVDEILESTPGELAKLCEYDEIPEVDDAAEKSQVVLAQPSRLEGEVTSLWAIRDPDVPDSPPIFLPEWFTQPIDKTILLWKQEAAVWEQRLQERRECGFDDFAPKMKAGFEQWLGDATRKIVLNKKTKTQVKRFADKTQKQLRKTCLMLEIHMSEKPENLGITAGAGKLWRLCLVQGMLPPSEAVPSEVDHFEGRVKFSFFSQPCSKFDWTR